MRTSPAPFERQTAAELSPVSGSSEACGKMTTLESAPPPSVIARTYMSSVEPPPPTIRSQPLGAATCALGGGGETERFVDETQAHTPKSSVSSGRIVRGWRMEGSPVPGSANPTRSGGVSGVPAQHPLDLGPLGHALRAAAADLE